MAIKRYTANEDNTITNAFKENFQTRGTGSNMGASDILETFTIYDQVPAIAATAQLFVTVNSPAIATDGSERFILTGSSQHYVFVAVGVGPGANQFDASGDRDTVLTNMTTLINTAASADFTASVYNGSVKIISQASGDFGNTNTLSSSLNNTTPQTEISFTGGTGGDETSNILINFPVSEISASRVAGEIPLSGGVSFYLRTHNAPHGQTLPKDYSLAIQAVSRSWAEGYGLDMDGYTDRGVSNWVSASSTTGWTSEGGDYHASPTYSQYLSTGLEDVEVDITPLVEEWLTGSKDSDGVGISISSSYADMARSFYVKMFFARGSQYFYFRPKIEARWDSARKDRRNSFYASSSLAPLSDNRNTIYIYNQIRGKLQNIPAIGTGSLSMSLYYGGATTPVGAVLQTATGSWVATGIYSASVIIDATSSYLYDVWHNAGNVYVTGSQISVRNFLTDTAVDTGEYVSNITNMKESYATTENARMRMFVRDKDWSPTIYTVATTNIETKVIESAYFKVFRIADDFDVIPYGTGSGNENYTQMSYDKDGNYFDIDMSLFETDYSYGIKVVYKIDDRYEEQPELFKFRVE